jgi:hypothetical protein
MKTEKEERHLQKLEEVKGLVNEKMKRQIELLCEKGAGAMLSALPLKSIDHVFDKQSFRDAICMRYDWNFPNTPRHCQCGEKHSTDHVLMCKKGGYVYMRHDNIRNLEASLLREVCKDVKIEQTLQLIGSAETLSSDNANKVRADVSAVGAWGALESEQLYLQHEQEKKRTLVPSNFACLEFSLPLIFVPLIFAPLSTHGSLPLIFAPLKPKLKADEI